MAMVGHAMDKGGLKDSKNASNSFFPKISRTGFWRFDTEMWLLQLLRTLHITLLNFAPKHRKLKSNLQEASSKVKFFLQPEERG